jgi:hypothetical protein
MSRLRVTGRLERLALPESAVPRRTREELIADSPQVLYEAEQLATSSGH